MDPMLSIPGYAFWQDGCAAMARNTCEVLRRAGLPASPCSIVCFVRTLRRSPYQLTTEVWQKSVCNKVLAAAFAKGHDARLQPLMDYFLVYFPSLPSPAQYMLIEAFTGIFDSIELDAADVPIMGNAQG